MFSIFQKKCVYIKRPISNISIENTAQSESLHQTNLNTFNDFNDKIYELRNKILDISWKCDPGLIFKMARLMHEKKITAKIESGYLEQKNLISTKSLMRGNGHSFRFCKIKNGIVKLPREIATSYPLIRLEDRVAPQPKLHKDVENALKSVYRYWDGQKWVLPTRSISSLSKLRKEFMSKGFEWPEFKKKDISFHTPIVSKADPEMMNHVFAKDHQYSQYVKKITRLFHRIRKIATRVRGCYSHLPQKLVHSNLSRLGYTKKYTPYARYIPIIHKNVIAKLKSPNYLDLEKIQKLTIRFRGLLQQRFSIWSLRSLRETYFSQLVDLIHSRSELLKNLQREIPKINIPKMREFGSSLSNFEKSANAIQLKIQKKKELDQLGHKLKFDKKSKIVINNHSIRIKPYHIYTNHLAAKTAKVHPDRLKYNLIDHKHYTFHRDCYLGKKFIKISSNKAELTLEQKAKKLKDRINMLNKMIQK